MEEISLISWNTTIGKGIPLTTDVYPSPLLRVQLVQTNHLGRRIEPHVNS